MKRFRVFLLIAACVLVIDQVSKALIRASLPIGGQCEVLPGWVQFTHVINHGAAWNVFSGQRWLLVGVALVVAVGVAMAAREIGRRSVMSNVGFGFIFGGAIGNLIDRIMAGAVTDFIDLDTPWLLLQRFPVWNGADAALTLGVVLLLIEFLRSPTSAPLSSVPVGEVEAPAKVL